MLTETLDSFTALSEWTYHVTFCLYQRLTSRRGEILLLNNPYRICCNPRTVMMTATDMNNVSVDTKIRNYLKEVRLSFDANEPALIHSALESVVILMGSPSEPPDKEDEFRKTSGNPSESGWSLVFQYFPTTADRRLAREHFVRDHYSKFADLLLDKLTLDWVDKLNKNKVQVSLLSIFLHGNHAGSFMVLLRRISTSR